MGVPPEEQTLDDATGEDERSAAHPLLRGLENPGARVGLLHVILRFVPISPARRQRDQPVEMWHGRRLEPCALQVRLQLVLRECEDRCANTLAGQSGTSMGPISDSLVAALVSPLGMRWRRRLFPRTASIGVQEARQQDSASGM